MVLSWVCCGLQPAAPPGGGPAWLSCVVWPGPRAVWCDRSRTHLLGLRWRTLSLRASTATAPWGLGSRPRRGGRRRGGERRRALWQLTIKLVVLIFHVNMKMKFLVSSCPPPPHSVMSVNMRRYYSVPSRATTAALTLRACSCLRCHNLTIPKSRYASLLGEYMVAASLSMPSSSVK